tara:strand:- start:12 stop:218 length:207 start_codon:yes stop_codon:yes gene_type:complete
MRIKREETIVATDIDGETVTLAVNELENVLNFLETVQDFSSSMLEEDGLADIDCAASVLYNLKNVRGY